MLENNKMVDNNNTTGISPPLSPCFQLLGSPAPPFTPSISSPPTLCFSSNVGNINHHLQILNSHNGSGSHQICRNIVNNNSIGASNIIKDLNSNSNGIGNSNSNSNNNNGLLIIDPNNNGGSISNSSTNHHTPISLLLSSSSIQTQEIHNTPLNTSTSSVPLPILFSPVLGSNNNSLIDANKIVEINLNGTSNSNGNINNNNNSNSDDDDDDDNDRHISKKYKIDNDNSNSILIDTSCIPNDKENISNNNNNISINNNSNTISPLDQSPIKLSINNNKTNTTTTTTTRSTSITTNLVATPTQQNTKKRTLTDHELDKQYLHMKTQQQKQLNAHTLTQQLLNREMYRSKPSTTSLESRKFYLNIVPDKTVYNIDIPNCIIKKFTSDGEMLLCFTKDLKEIQLYRFLGSNYINNKYQYFNDNNSNNGNNRNNYTKEQIENMERQFTNYFKIIYQSIIPTSFHEYLNRDFSLTTLCGKYFILASSGPTQSPNGGLSGGINSSTSGIGSIPQIQSLKLPNSEDITFYLVSIKDGVVRDRIHFKNDVIHLAHHSGVYLYKNLFIILSLQYQVIHIFQIKDSNFISLKSIGPYCNEDDPIEIELQDRKELPHTIQQNEQMNIKKSYSSITPMNPTYVLKQRELLSNSTPSLVPNSNPSLKISSLNLSNSHGSLPTSLNNVNNNNNNTTTNINNSNNNVQNNNNNNSSTTTSGTTTTATTTTTTTTSPNNTMLFGIKQRFLSYLFKKAHQSKDSKKALSLYYSLFPQYCNLVMWKMQSLDAQHLLIKFGTIEGLLGRVADFCNQICFFVVYNTETTDIIGVYENSNKEFANTFEQFCEHFRACSCPSGLIKFRSTCSNNSYVREHLVKQKLAVVKARYGGETQAVKRILSALPFSPQSWNESPYFDKYLFSYDEKIISSTERPKPLVDLPIKFYSRVSGEVKFKLNTGSLDRNDRQSKKYATYIFHPYYPFIISLQHSNGVSSVFVNFHFIGDGGEREDIYQKLQQLQPQQSPPLNSSINND